LNLIGSKQSFALIQSETTCAKFTPISLGLEDKADQLFRFFYILSWLPFTTNTDNLLFFDHRR
jgi:hypothetical protein